MARTKQLTADSNSLEIGSCAVARTNFGAWSSGATTLSSTSGTLVITPSSNYITKLRFNYTTATSIKYKIGSGSETTVTSSSTSGVVVIDFEKPTNSAITITVGGASGTTSISAVYITVGYFKNINGIYFNNASTLSGVNMYIPSGKNMSGVYIHTPDKYDDIYKTKTTYSVSSTTLTMNNNDTDITPVSSTTLTVNGGYTAGTTLTVVDSLK